MSSRSRINLGASLGFLIETMVVAFWTRYIPRRKLSPSICCSSQVTISNSKAWLTSVQSAKAIWDFEGIYCTSRHIPHVKFAGLIHPGILGCAPSPEVLATWNKREAELIAANKLERDVALPPLAKNCHAGSADEVTKEKIGNEGARTIPGRPEHGGNCDIKNLSRGSKVYLPVHVAGAKFSVGDLHFSRELLSAFDFFSLRLVLTRTQRAMVKFPSAVRLRWRESSPSILRYFFSPWHVSSPMAVILIKAAAGSQERIGRDGRQVSYLHTWSR